MTDYVDIPLPKHVLRALMGAAAKIDVREYLKYIALDTSVPGEPPTLVSTNGIIMTVYPLALSEADEAALRTLTEGKTLLFRPMQNASAAAVTLRVLPAGFVQVQPTTGGAAGAWLPTTAPSTALTYPDWRSVDAFHSGDDEEWLAGSGPTPLDISLLHAVWAGGWVLRHHPKSPGVMRATPRRAGTLTDPPTVRVTFMGMRF